MTDFLTADTNLPSYMMFPRFLLDMEINETAKMLYMILRKEKPVEPGSKSLHLRKREMRILCVMEPSNKR